MDSIGLHTQHFLCLVPYPGVFQEYGCPTQQRCRLPKRHHPDAVLQQLSLFLMQDFVPNMQDRPEISLHQFQQALTVKRNPASFNKSLRRGEAEAKYNIGVLLFLNFSTFPQGIELYITYLIPFS